MKDFLLVLLGAIISCGTTYFLDWLKFERDEKLHIKRNRENIYLELLRYVTHINANKKFMIENRNFPDEEKARYNNILVGCKLYGTSRVAGKFYQLMEIIINDINNATYTNTSKTYDDLFVEIRKDLNIED